VLFALEPLHLLAFGLAFLASASAEPVLGVVGLPTALARAVRLLYAEVIETGGEAGIADDPLERADGLGFRVSTRLSARSGALATAPF
jgi:hypothetical protein